MAKLRVDPPLRWLLGALMVGVGILHFVRPGQFAAIVPKALPAPLLLVYISGVAEILGGIGLQLPQTRRWAAFGLIALYVAVFPANINMAVNHLPLGDMPMSPTMLWLRLPLQLVLIAWAWRYTRPGAQTPPRSVAPSPSRSPAQS